MDLVLLMKSNENQFSGSGIILRMLMPAQRDFTITLKN